MPFLELDTASALTPTDAVNLYVTRLQADVDMLSIIYNGIKDKGDHFNQVILLISSAGALTSSITAIAGLSGWEMEIIPIVIQTSAGLIAAWIRFYDFPKRMEEIINAKKNANDAKMRFMKSASVTKTLWEDYAGVQHEICACITPDEKMVAIRSAIKYRRAEMKAEDDIYDLAVLGNNHSDGSDGNGKTNHSPRIQSDDSGIERVVRKRRESWAVPAAGGSMQSELEEERQGWNTHVNDIKNEQTRELELEHPITHEVAMRSMELGVPEEVVEGERTPILEQEED